MESYLKKFMRELLEHKNNLNEYVDELYADDTREDDLNALFGALKKEGLLSCIYADNRAYEVQLTLKGKNLPASELKLSDKEELLLLISSIDDIEKLFHKNEGKRNLGEWIHDVPEFQDWLQQVMFYLQKIQDKKYSQYILETINEGRNWGGITDRIVFNKFTGRLKSISKNIDLYYENEEDVDIKEKKAQTQPMKQYDVFISHANSDKLDYVEDLYQTISRLGINVFYDKETFEWGDNWKQKIYDGVDSSEFAIIVISNNYFGREWTEKELQSFLNRQNSSGEKIILPLLHGISIKDLCDHYPELGEIQAISDSQFDIKDVAILFARQLLKRYRKNG